MNDEPSGPSTKSINEAAQGDPDARDRVVKMVRDEMARVAGGRVDDRGDIAQEVALAVHVGLKSPAQFENRRRFWGWVRRIGRNKVVDHLRRKRRGEAKVMPTQLDQIDSDTSHPSQIAANHELISWAHAAIAELSDEDRLVWSMCSQADADFCELAKRFQSTHEALKKRYYRLRERLQNGIHLLIRLEHLRRSGLAEIPENYHRAIVWHEITNLTQQEIAQRLGVSPKGVARMLGRARAIAGGSKESGT